VTIDDVFFGVKRFRSMTRAEKYFCANKTAFALQFAAKTITEVLRVAKKQQKYCRLSDDIN
jgi:hypothetical protein